MDHRSPEASRLPGIIVTGASGFIGRHFINVAKDDFRIYALAHKSQQDAGVPIHDNIHWMLADLSESETVRHAFAKIAEEGGADFVFHCAVFYDFTNEPHPEYTRMNVIGTRSVLQCAAELDLKRFVFLSSLVVNDFRHLKDTINEQTAADASFPYADSKIEGEKDVAEYSAHFPCTTIRLAAVYGDWCELSPLNALLTTWLSGKWNCNILAGKGEAAIPYLHVADMASFLLKVIQRNDQLSQHQVLIASPDGCTSHRELFEIAAKYHYFHSIKPLFVPKWLAYLGVVLWGLLGRLRSKRPFERVWMMKYVDRQMKIDASATRELLKWEPSPRFHIKRRLLFLIANLKRSPYEWQQKNQDTYHAFVVESENLAIYEAMVMAKGSIIEDTINRLNAPENADQFAMYQQLEGRRLIERIEAVYQMVETDIRTGDRMNIRGYAQQLAHHRFREGFVVDEVVGAIRVTADAILSHLMAQSKLHDLGQRIHDEITMTIQLAIDEVEDSFQKLTIG